MVLTAGGTLAAFSSGAIAVAKLIEHVFNTTVRIKAQREDLLTDAARARLERAQLEHDYAKLMTDVPPSSGHFEALDAEVRIGE